MKYSSSQSGFTLIEMLVSLSLFTIVMTITLGTLLVLIKGNQVSVAEQSVMDTLAFSLDSMTREIRTGSYYVCASVSSITNPVNPPVSFTPSLLNRRIFDPSSDNHDGMDTTSGGPKSRNCAGGKDANNHAFHGISFIEGGNSITQGSASRIMYYFDDVENTIKRRVGNGLAEPIISAAVEIINAEFFVTGTARLSYPTFTPPLSPAPTPDALQPVVTVVIEAKEVGVPDEESVMLQTTITQQSLDL